MPFFGGLFSKRDKKSSNSSASSPDTSRASAVSEQDYESQWESVSQTTHSHHHGSDINSDATPVSSLLKLPFRTRKTSGSPRVPLDQISAKRISKSYTLYGSSSDADANASDLLRPPLRPDALSTRSLPVGARTAPDASTYQDLLSDTSGERKKVVPKKSSGLLAWARERTKSRPSSPPPLPVESFNLKAFRHVRPESPSSSLQLSECPSSTVSTERPNRSVRPRGKSTASDSSNRISIAAFREAQARRSATNSPVPSFRPSTDTLTNRSLTPTRSVPQIHQTRSTAANRRSTARTISIRVSSSSSSSTSSSSSEEDSDEDVTLTVHGTQKRTAKKRVPPRAQSDLGHGQSSDRNKSTEPCRPSLSHSSHSAPAQQTSPRSSVVPHDQPQAAASNNVSANDGANKRPPTASSKTGGPSKKKKKKRQSSDSDSSSNYSSEVDSDDAPLATLVAPRRPGSASSSTSHLRSRIPAKPLIDINTLITDRPGFTSPEPVVNTNKGKEKAEVEDSAGLAKLAALAREDENRRATSPTPAVNNLKVVAPQPQVAINKPLLRKLTKRNRHHRRSSSDIVTSSREGESSASLSTSRATTSVSPVPGTMSSSVDTTPLVQAPISPPRNTMVSPVASDPDDVDDDDIMPALRYMMPDTYDVEPAPPPPVVESPPSPGRVPDQERIIPTPIRERRPPSSFSVTSRPQHRPKQSSTSTITPGSMAASVLPLPPSSPPPLKSPKTMTAPSTSSPSSVAVASKSNSPRIGRARSSSMLNMSMEQFPSSRSSSSPSPNLSPSPMTRASPIPTSKSSPSLKSQSQSQSPSPSSKSTTPFALSRRSGSRSGISPPLVASTSSVDSLPQVMPPPSKPKPFITSAMRKDSPASSTGDSSSGRVPLTPNESDFGDKADGDRGRRPGGLRPGGERKANRRSVSFEDEVEFAKGREREPAKDPQETAMDGENKRRERRRSEAKASIELGNVINGRGPIDLDDEDDHNMLGRNVGAGMNQFNPMMAMGGPVGFPSGPGPPPGWHPWQQPGQSLMPPAQFGQDPSFLLAHQQAMMIAKQTYQMAVAQHALAVAGDEWERSSNVSGLGGGSQLSGFGGGGPAGLGGNMNMGMGMGMGMFGMGGGMGGYPGMGMGMPNAWPNGSLMVPPVARSAYGDFGSAQSDYSDNPSNGGGGWGSRTDYGGGGNGGGSWGSRSVHAESFSTPSRDRSARGFTGGGLLAQHQHQQQKQQKQQQQQTHFPPYKEDREFRNGPNEANGYRAEGGSASLGRNSRPGPRPRTLTAPSSTQLPAQHSSRTRDEPPPSSWSRFQPGT